MKVQIRAHVTGDVLDTPPTKHQPLRVQDAHDFLASLPTAAADAEIEPIMWDRGSQRDPEPFLHGLEVQWEEER